LTESLAVQQLPLAVGLEAEADFEGYLPGPNGEAAAAVASLAAGSGDPFVYLFGPAGTGKTHLLVAACRHAAAAAATAVYLPLADPDLTPCVLDELERADLVALDDLQVIAGRRDWELGLFDLYNRLRETRGNLLVAADTPVAELPVALADLRSRLAWGPAYRLRALGERDCERLLVRAAERRGLRLSQKAATYILRRWRREPEQLMALLERLDQASLSRKRRPSLTLIRELLRSAQP
jgi:DnaA family protein